jgi:hypothetical protein
LNATIPKRETRKTNTRVVPKKLFLVLKLRRPKGNCPERTFFSICSNTIDLPVTKYSPSAKRNLEKTRK